MRRLRLSPLRLLAAAALASLAGAGVAYAAGLPVASGHVWAGRQALTKGTCNQGAATATDTYVDQANPTANLSAATTLSVSSSSGSLRYTFVRFDLGGCGIPATGGADSATLTLRVTAASRSNHTISVYPVYSSWDGTLTWNGVGALSIGGTAVTTFSTATGAKTLTVTSALDSAIKAGAFWGFELVDTAGPQTNTTTIASSENATAANRPSLALSYEK